MMHLGNFNENCGSCGFKCCNKHMKYCLSCETNLCLECWSYTRNHYDNVNRKKLKNQSRCGLCLEKFRNNDDTTNDNMMDDYVNDYIEGKINVFNNNSPSGKRKSNLRSSYTKKSNNIDNNNSLIEENTYKRKLRSYHKK